MESKQLRCIWLGQLGMYCMASGPGPASSVSTGSFHGASVKDSRVGTLCYFSWLQSWGPERGAGHRPLAVEPGIPGPHHLLLNPLWLTTGLYSFCLREPGEKGLTWQYSGLTIGSVLRYSSWRRYRNHLWFQRWNLSAKQTLYMLYLSPADFFFLVGRGSPDSDQGLPLALHTEKSVLVGSGIWDAM